jgi:hypothetical protein
MAIWRAKIAFFAAALGWSLALAPHEAAACRDPSDKVAAISVALEKAKLGEKKRAQVIALRDKARNWRLPGQHAEAQAAADKALKFLKVKYKEPASKTRC